MLSIKLPNQREKDKHFRASVISNYKYFRDFVRIALTDAVGYVNSTKTLPELRYAWDILQSSAKTQVNVTLPVDVETSIREAHLIYAEKLPYTFRSFSQFASHAIRLKTEKVMDLYAEDFHASIDTEGTKIRRSNTSKAPQICIKFATEDMKLNITDLASRSSMSVNSLVHTFTYYLTQIADLAEKENVQPFQMLSKMIEEYKTFHF